MPHTRGWQFSDTLQLHVGKGSGGDAGRVVLAGSESVVAHCGVRMESQRDTKSDGSIPTTDPMVHLIYYQYTKEGKKEEREEERGES